jgi:hypothetical protein
VKKIQWVFQTGGQISTTKVDNDDEESSSDAEYEECMRIMSSPYFFANHRWLIISVSANRLSTDKEIEETLNKFADAGRINRKTLDGPSIESRELIAVEATRYEWSIEAHIR